VFVARQPAVLIWRHCIERARPSVSEGHRFLVLSGWARVQSRGTSITHGVRLAVRANGCRAGLKCRGAAGDAGRQQGQQTGARQRRRGGGRFVRDVLRWCRRAEADAVRATLNMSTRGREADQVFTAMPVSRTQSAMRCQQGEFAGDPLACGGL